LKGEEFKVLGSYEHSSSSPTALETLYQQIRLVIPW